MSGECVCLRSNDPSPTRGQNPNEAKSQDPFTVCRPGAQRRCWRWEVNHGSGLWAHHRDNEAGRPDWLAVGRVPLNPLRFHLQGQPFPPNPTGCWWKHDLRKREAEGWRAGWGHLVARLDKTQFEKPVEGNDCFWPPSCYTARAVYCAVCWGGAILQAFLRRDLLDVKLIVYIVDSEQQGLKIEGCWVQWHEEDIYPQKAQASNCSICPTDLGLANYWDSTAQWPPLSPSVSMFQIVRLCWL